MADELSGTQILERAEAAYAALSSYSGTSAAIEVLAGHTMSVRTASARIQFLRSCGLNIEGDDPFGGPFKIISSPQRMWFSDQRTEDGAWKSWPTSRISTMGGIGLGTAATIPRALDGSLWNHPTRRSERAELRGRESIPGTECFVVVCERETIRETFWVESASFLLRQMREEQEEHHWAAFAADFAKSHANKATVAGMMSMKSSMSLHVFAITSTNEPLDEALFQKPA